MYLHNLSIDHRHANRLLNLLVKKEFGNFQLFDKFCIYTFCSLCNVVGPHLHVVPIFPISGLHMSRSLKRICLINNYGVSCLHLYIFSFFSTDVIIGMYLLLVMGLQLCLPSSMQCACSPFWNWDILYHFIFLPITSIFDVKTLQWSLLFLILCGYSERHTMRTASRPNLRRRKPRKRPKQRSPKRQT